MVKFEQININDLKPAEYNPRIMPPAEMEKLKKGINTFGLVDPIIIDLTDNNTVIGGHQRLEALKEIDDEMELQLIRLGDIGLVIKETELRIKDKNDQKALNLSLNKINGDWDYGLLDDLLIELGEAHYDLDLTGFDMIELSGIDIDAALQLEEETTPKREREHSALKDRIDVPPIQTEIKKGDIFKLGNHRLICGDCTDEVTLKKLLQDNTVDIQFSSPPYNTTNNYEKSKYIQETIMTDEEYLEFLTSIVQLSIKYATQSFINIQHNAPIKKTCIEWLYNNKDVYNTTIIWNKLYTQPNPLHTNILRHCYEYIHIFSKQGNNIVGTIPNKTGNDDVITTEKQNKNNYALYHNATYPLKLAEIILTNFCNNTVLDMFGGTGTTIIAAETTNKKCYTVEILPEYCQIIIDRWEEHTGQKAIKLN